MCAFRSAYLSLPFYGTMLEFPINAQGVDLQNPFVEDVVREMLSTKSLFHSFFVFSHHRWTVCPRTLSKLFYLYSRLQSFLTFFLKAEADRRDVGCHLKITALAAKETPSNFKARIIILFFRRIKLLPTKTITPFALLDSVWETTQTLRATHSQN